LIIKQKGQAMNDETDLIYHKCQKFLHWQKPENFSETLETLARYSRENGYDQQIDTYGNGIFLQNFESQIAKDFGFEAAIFMPTGVMAQQIALRLYSDESENKNFGMHETCHLEQNEYHGYKILQNLNGTLLGDKNRPFNIEDIQQCPEKLAAIILELPMRHLGGVLPSWEELLAIKHYCRDHGIRLHIDGARLFDCSAFYQKSGMEISSLADSLYLSFYKGIGGLSGAMLLGKPDFIDSASTWRKRMGGTPYQLHPYALSAKMKYEERKNQFPKYFKQACDIAGILNKIDGITTRPFVPQSNMMHVIFSQPSEEMTKRRNEVANKELIWPVGRFQEGDVPGTSFAELYLTENALEVTNSEIKKLFTQMAQS
jgi:threonine aldolase